MIRSSDDILILRAAFALMFEITMSSCKILWQKKEEEVTVIYHPTLLVGATVWKRVQPVRVGADSFGMERIVGRQLGASVAREMAWWKAGKGINKELEMSEKIPLKKFC